MQSIPFCSKLFPLSKHKGSFLIILPVQGSFLIILPVQGVTAAASDVGVVSGIHDIGT